MKQTVTSKNLCIYYTEVLQMDYVIITDDVNFSGELK